MKDKGDKWLKALLLIHGVFAVTCFVMPILGLFSADMGGVNWIGTVILEFWCVYFIPVGVLAFRYFHLRAGNDTQISLETRILHTEQRYQIVSS